MAGGVLLVCSGWFYVALKTRLIGAIHGLLMLSDSGYCLSVGLPFFLNPRGMADNAAAGVIALANFVVTAVGVLAGACGVGVLTLAFAGAFGNWGVHSR